VIGSSGRFSTRDTQQQMSEQNLERMQSELRSITKTRRAVPSIFQQSADEPMPPASGDELPDDDGSSDGGESDDPGKSSTPPLIHQHINSILPFIEVEVESLQTQYFLLKPAKCSMGRDWTIFPKKATDFGATMDSLYR
jgi:hypothetical protein